MKINKLLFEIQGFKTKPKHQKISDPNKEILITTLSKEITQCLNLINSKVTITRKSLKHIVESRESKMEDVDYIVNSIPEVLNHPTKIADNFSKRKNSHLFAKMNGKGKAVVLEVSEKEAKNRVVSAFFMDKKTYNKLKNILGRADVPPSAIQ